MNRMEQMGVSNVSKTSTIPGNIETQNGTAMEMQFEGDYVKQDIEFSLQIPEKGAETYSFSRVETSVRAVTGFWKAGGDFYLAGGAFPTEDISKQKRVPITAGHRQGIDAIISINLRFDPSQYKQQTQKLIGSVQ
ncbi:hypothetical protein [Haloarcula sp. Atlit-120R]|uniref:hypothetical protein n=1 Tax=Haloarcula sp. Atlit-120R TaxID=2282135 RepID=UPI000EF18103|nr:hypothetical protein [Haloarcula sp. Atlit-120R]RLM33151.1 hypothetical protein DVK01_18340 [Haloarcula sp. Atlit-120R]